MKKIAGKIHLWLGLISGLVVIIIAITGALYCFAPELQDLTQGYRTVQERKDEFLPPSRLQKLAENQLHGKSPQRIYYGSKTQAVVVWFSKKEAFDSSIFINPYSGQVLKVRDNDKDFFTVVLKLHRTLLIPYGHEVIRWSTVFFLMIMVSGIILWWPKNNHRAKAGFIVNWRASPKRLNYDLHRVLGFYASWIVIFTALTGLMFAFENFAGLIYKLTGVEYSVIQSKPPLSDANANVYETTPPIDLVWKSIRADLDGKYATALFVLPSTKDGAILLRANPDREKLHKTDFRYFDQFTAKEITGAYVWGSYKDARTAADHIKRMNYDVHTGAIFGLPGRIALFFAALIVASLPITGFCFWWAKYRKRQRRWRRFGKIR